MIDLHCHILPMIDDGARSLDMSLDMARLAVSDGIRVAACTPHILPGVYDNNGDSIARAVETLQSVLEREGIPLQLVIGADVHMDIGLTDGLRSGRIAPINGSRYFLFEPPHHVAPPRIEDNVFSIMAAGYVPILTHPERLSWIDTHYAIITTLADRGMWMQLTAGSITGRFGTRVRYWSERMLDEGLVHIVATDAHNMTSRPPVLSRARDAVAKRLGDAEARNMTLLRPAGIIENKPPHDIEPRPSPAVATAADAGLWQRLGRFFARS